MVYMLGLCVALGAMLGEALRGDMLGLCSSEVLVVGLVWSSESIHTSLVCVKL